MANKTRAQLLSQINTLLNDNTNNEISAEDIRNVITYLVESLYNLSDDTTVAISGFEAAVSANTNVAANTALRTSIQTTINNNTSVLQSAAVRHSHTIQPEVLDNNIAIESILDNSGEAPDGRVNQSGTQIIDKNFSSVTALVNDNRLMIVKLSDSIDDLLSKLRNFGIITP